MQNRKTDEYILKIERANCFGKSPTYRFEVFSNQTLLYEGMKKVTRIGKGTLQINSNRFRELKKQIEGLPFSAYEDQYGRTIRDISYIMVTLNNKRVKMTLSQGPEELMQLVRMVEEEFQLL